MLPEVGTVGGILVLLLFRCFFLFCFTFSAVSIILYPFPIFRYLYVLNSSPHKEQVLVHCLETLLVNTCSLEVRGVTNE